MRAWAKKACRSSKRRSTGPASRPPSQPLTAGAWTPVDGFPCRGERRLLGLSDIVSFHAYEDPEGVKKKIGACAAYGRPLLCTEWLKRQDGNAFDAALPVFAEHGVGWYHWGLVAGRTQTYMPWGSGPGATTPETWQHDVLRPDGSPYDAAELRCVRRSASLGTVHEADGRAAEGQAQRS